MIIAFQMMPDKYFKTQSDYLLVQLSEELGLINC
jgi:hypothetical protein